MVPVWLAIAAQKIMRDQQNAEAKRQGQAQIAGEFAGKMGAPTYGLQAAGINHAASMNPGPNLLAPVLAAGGSGGGASMPTVAPVAPPYNPMASGKDEERPPGDEEDPYSIYRRHMGS